MSRKCTVPISSLIVSPFNLPYGSSIFATVTAINVYDKSQTSLEGNGAIILREPDPPVNLANNPDITSGSQIGLTWAQGVNNGGTPVTDFTLAYKYGSNDYAIVESGIKQ